jgi:hypothetical protein
MSCYKGNKSDLSSSATAPNSEFRFDKHTDTAPYSGASDHRAGSGSIGGAGYGNKTGEFGSGSGGTSLVVSFDFRRAYYT